MVQNVSSQGILAEIYLAHIPVPNRHLAVRDLSASLHKNHYHSTVQLLAQVLLQYPDSEVEKTLRLFLLARIDDGESYSVATLCVQDRSTRDWLIQYIAADLVQVVSSAIKSSDVDDTGLLISQLSVDVNGGLGPSSSVQHSTRARLSFLTNLFRAWPGKTSLSIPSSVLDGLLAQVISADASISNAARDALYAFLRALRAYVTIAEGDLNIDPDLLSRRMWRCIKSLLASEMGKHSRSTGYQIWSRWLDLQHTKEELTMVMNSDEYWSFMQTALATGDVEQRKACLYILKKSLQIAEDIDIQTAHVRLERSKSAKEQRQQRSEYDRFCVVYETIVLGRYLNQIQACLGDLDELASSKSLVDMSWIYSLLAPALAPSMQDSIKKVIGNWLMNLRLRPNKHYAYLAWLLSSYFLPWATQGHLFTGSLSGARTDTRCEYGERLSTFVSNLLPGYSGTDQCSERSLLGKVLIDYIQQNKNKIMSYAVVYLLHGLRHGLADEMNASLHAQELTSLLEISLISTFPEVARDSVAAQCQAICQPYAAQISRLAHEDETNATVTRLAQLTRRVEALRSPHNYDQQPTSAHPRWSSIDSFVQELNDTRYTCLTGTGLLDACQSMPLILDAAQQVSASTLFSVIDALWCETEIQDYPKAALLLISDVCLHTKAVSSALENTEMAKLLSSFLTDMVSLAQGRIYVWAPLMTALRKALYQFPRVADHLPLEEVLVTIADRPPAAKFEFQLEAAASITLCLVAPEYEHLTYERYYGAPEGLGYAAFFDVISRLGRLAPRMLEPLLQRLLQPWQDQKLPQPIVSSWKTTEHLQIILLLLEQRLVQATLKESKQYLTSTLRLLAVEPVPRFRFLFEWMIMRIAIRHHEVSNTIIEALDTKDHHSNPKYLASLTKIAVMIAGLNHSTEQFAVRVASTLAALSASSKIIIRHESQWCFPVLWEHCIVRGWTRVTENLALQSLMEYIRSLERYSTPLARQLERLDPVTEYTLVNLLCGKYLQLEPPGLPLVSWQDFFYLWKTDEESSIRPAAIPAACIPLGDEPLKTPDSTVSGPVEVSDFKSSARREGLGALQTKGTAYLTSTVDHDNKARPSDLLVVASLVDNAYNLGGLSRVSEIFGAATLYISNPNTVLANKDFISVAVASQNHLPIEGLAVNDMVSFLTGKKNEGYCVVGIEQTDRSVMLGDEGTKLPKKTLLMLGAEKEGIPGQLLGECDLLVEIPQKGVTRSLNVQTAAAAVLFEYSRQHREVK